MSLQQITYGLKIDYKEDYFHFMMDSWNWTHIGYSVSIINGKNPITR